MKYTVLPTPNCTRAGEVVDTQLTEQVKELIRKAQIVSFATWQETYPDECIRIFQKADDEGRYLTNAECTEIERLAPNIAACVAIACSLRDQASEIVNEARGQVLATFPNIVEPGGDLFPAERAEACWRDFWHFLRCITYGIAGQNTQFLSHEGLRYMEKLYQALGVPMPAMVLGVETLKDQSLKRVKADEIECIAPYFDQLLVHLQGFGRDPMVDDS